MKLQGASAGDLLLELLTRLHQQGKAEFIDGATTLDEIAEEFGVDLEAHAQKLKGEHEED